SRRRHTRLVSDWSSDVCSSDLEVPVDAGDLASPGGSDDAIKEAFRVVWNTIFDHVGDDQTKLGKAKSLLKALAELTDAGELPARSEERRVGKEERGGWATER